MRLFDLADENIRQPKFNTTMLIVRAFGGMSISHLVTDEAGRGTYLVEVKR